MPLAHSRLTAQGQISVPSEIRRETRDLDLGRYSNGTRRNEEVIVRKAGQHTLADVHDALFPDDNPKRKASTSVKDGIRAHIRQKYARS